MPTHSAFKRHPVLSLRLALSLALLAALPAEAVTHSRSSLQQPVVLQAQLWGRLDPHIADQVTSPRRYQVHLQQSLGSQRHSATAVPVKAGLARLGTAFAVTLEQGR